MGGGASSPAGLIASKVKVVKAKVAASLPSRWRHRRRAQQRGAWTAGSWAHRRLRNPWAALAEDPYNEEAMRRIVGQRNIWRPVPGCAGPSAAAAAAAHASHHFARSIIARRGVEPPFRLRPGAQAYKLTRQTY